MTTGSQKALKVISWIVIVFAILSIVLGVVALAGGSLMAGASLQAEGQDQQNILIVSGLAFGVAAAAIIGGIVDFIIGMLGLRGAKNPNKIGVFFVIAIIGLILAIIDFVAPFVLKMTLTPTTLASGVVEVLLMVIVVALANNIRKLRTK